jgi:hypothetical protein
LAGTAQGIDTPAMLCPDRSQPCLARLSDRHRERYPCPVLVRAQAASWLNSKPENSSVVAECTLNSRSYILKPTTRVGAEARPTLRATCAGVPTPARSRASIRP